LERMHKPFGSRTAAEKLNVWVHAGEFLVLVGPCGCGKTTTLRMLAGLERPSYGRILIGDKLVNNVSPRFRDVAMVFQSYALYPHMNVYDNLAFGMRARGAAGSVIAQRVKETAEVLGLAQLMKRRPSELSGGQRQRVALGRALIRQPQVFLMDEPLSNLDAGLRVQMRAELSRLHQRFRVTTVYVTHDQVEAMTMGDRIAVMNNGRLQQVDAPETLHADAQRRRGRRRTDVPRGLCDRAVRRRDGHSSIPAEVRREAARARRPCPESCAPTSFRRPERDHDPAAAAGRGGRDAEVRGGGADQ